MPQVCPPHPINGVNMSTLHLHIHCHSCRRDSEINDYLKDAQEHFSIFGPICNSSLPPSSPLPTHPSFSPPFPIPPLLPFFPSPSFSSLFSSPCPSLLLPSLPYSSSPPILSLPLLLLPLLLPTSSFVPSLTHPPPSLIPTPPPLSPPLPPPIPGLESLSRATHTVILA